MQRILNYGSTLQAYALRRLIEGVDPGVRVAFLDYEPGPTLLGDGGVPRSRLGRAVAKVREYNQPDVPLLDRLRFLNHKRSYARKYLPLLDLPRFPHREAGLDVQVIGSDEVFNCVQANTNVGYSRDLFGHGSTARRLVSYAASFGNTTLAKIDRAGIGGEIAEDLRRFDSISVRDANSADIVEALTGTRPPIHVDPALAYVFDEEVDRIRTDDQQERPYLIVYGYSGRLGERENRALRSYADQLGARILTLGGVQACGDRFIDASPLEVLSYFRGARGVVTDTFHGTIFAVINRIPFVSLVRPSEGAGYGNEEKLGFLLRTLGLEERRLTDMADLSDLMAREIDFDAVQVVLERERQRTVEYLAEAVAPGGTPRF